VIKTKTQYGNSCSTVRSNDKGILVLFFGTRTSELLISTGDFRTTGGDDDNARSTGRGLITSTGSGLASRGSISFVGFFLRRVSTRSKDYYFENFARVFVLARRTCLGIACSGGASLAKRLDRRAPAIWNFILTKLRLN
jgi:hypothetical protein